MPVHGWQWYVNHSNCFTHKESLKRNAFWRERPWQVFKIAVTAKSWSQLRQFFEHQHASECICCTTLCHTKQQQDRRSEHLVAFYDCDDRAALFKLAFPRAQHLSTEEHEMIKTVGIDIEIAPGQYSARAVTAINRV